MRKTQGATHPGPARTLAKAGLAGFALAASLATPAAAWEPSKPVTFIIPAGTGGGGLMARG